MEPLILYDFVTKKIFVKIIKSYLSLKIAFFELLENACDNVSLSRRLGLNPKQIEVTMNDKEITIKNYGNVIPLIINPHYNKYVPDIIFGELNIIGSFNDNYMYHNVRGARFSNMISKSFHVKIQDKDKYYSRTWYDNMEKSTVSIIRTTDTRESYVEITYVPNFQKCQIEKYPKYMIQLFAAYCISQSNKLKIPILFNDEYLTNHTYTDDH